MINNSSSIKSLIITLVIHGLLFLIPSSLIKKAEAKKNLSDIEVKLTTTIANSQINPIKQKKNLKKINPTQKQKSQSN